MTKPQPFDSSRPHAVGPQLEPEPPAYRSWATDPRGISSIPTLSTAQRELRGPARGEADIWWCATDTDPWIHRGLRASLSPDERSRAAAFRFQRDRYRFEARRGQVRDILASALGCEAPDVVFDVTPQGQPVLRPGAYQTALAFNVSHRAGVALVALTSESIIGVDVEQLRPVRDLQAVARHVFTDGELQLGLGDDQTSFLRHWTRKEALLKALGTGLLLDPARVDLQPLTGGAGGWRWARRPELTVSDLMLGNAHVGALCLPPTVRSVNYRVWAPRPHHSADPRFRLTAGPVENEAPAGDSMPFSNAAGLVSFLRSIEVGS